MGLFGKSKESFLREFLVLKHGIPSHDSTPSTPSIRRASARSSCGQSEAGQSGSATASWGLTGRRFFADVSARSPEYFVQAFASEGSPDQIAVRSKSNEITPMHRLSLDPFDVTQDIDRARESGWSRLQQRQSCTGSGFRFPKEILRPRHCPPVRRLSTYHT